MLNKEQTRKEENRKQFLRQIKENSETLTTRIAFIYNIARYIGVIKVNDKEKTKWEKIHETKIEHL